jgi:hypothetical protein
MKRIIFPVLLLSVVFAGSSARGQSGPHYTGSLEYSLPLLTAVPPLYTGQPSDVTSAYLWADELMRTTKWNLIDRWIGNLSYGDTMKYLAKMLYRVSDDNPLSLYQWEVSANPNSLSQHLPWVYKGFPASEVGELANQIGGNMGDSGRTGFILVSDIIADVSISDTFVYYSPSDVVVPHMVFVKSTILDEIKGQQIPLCVGEDMRAHRKNNGVATQSYATPWPTHAVPADTGTCLMFEYSPEWSSGIAGDELPYGNQLQDSTGFWIKPGGEYIVFLRLAGVGSDTSNGYFSVQPFWGVFGSQGAMYRVVGGIVQDPNDDFNLGASGGLPVLAWKSRLRTRIYNILHP